MKTTNFFIALLLNIAYVSIFAQGINTKSIAGLLQDQTNDLSGVSSAENLSGKSNGTKSLMEDWETGDMSSFPWVTEGDTLFYVSSTNPYEGNYCVESGSISDNQFSSLSITIESYADDSISFYRKVSSEITYDYLRFFIDGSQKGAWSGNLDWQKYTYYVTEGTHNFEWKYTKDNSVSNGSDCGWIDNISFPAGLRTPKNLIASFDFSTAIVSLKWEYFELPDFQHFNVYRNDSVIGITTDTVFFDTLTSYGEYNYKISAVYSEGESNFSNTEIVLYSIIEIDKEELNYGLLLTGSSSTQQFTISNIGSTLLSGTITTPVDFVVDEAKNSLNFSIQPLSSKTFNLTFSPTLDQEYSGDVVISHNGGGTDKIITVTGEGTILVQLPYIESFETDFGEWEQSIDDDSDWTRISGYTPSSSTGPSSAFDGDYYIYTEATNMYPDKKFGLKESFDFSSITKPYLSFWYNMYGSSMGTLKVQVSLDGTNWADIWSLSGNQGNIWQEANIDLSVFAGLNIITVRFLGITGSSYTSDIAIDYISLFDNLDSPSNLVAQLNSLTSVVNLTWNFETSKSFQYFNVYRNDTLIGTTTDTAYIDTLTGFGTYKYKVSAVHTEGESPFSNVQTISHSSFAPTDLVGSLNNTTSEVVLNWKFETSKSFQNFNIYRNNTLIGTSTDTTFSEILTAFGAYSYKVTALWEEGESEYSNTKTFIHSAVVPTGLATVFDSVTATVDLSWTFDNSKAFQHFNIYRNDVLTGISTDTSYTDVLPDFGVYDYKVTSLYDEGESGYSNIETIVYTSIGVSPAIVDFGAGAVEKSYTKQIVIKNIGNTFLIGGITTPEGFSVNNEKNTLTYLIPAMSSDTFNIVFSPTVQQLYSGDIIITHNAAGPDKTIAVNGEGFVAYTLPYEESFESGFANWMFSDDDDDNWTRQSGSTGSYGTGPSAAYDGDYYLYTESNYNYNSDFGLEAVFSFEGVPFPAIFFWYHMYGAEMGILKVQASIDGGNNWSDVWTLSGNQGNQWYQAKVDLTEYTNQEMVFVRFWGHTGPSYKSDMAIDMVELLNNPDAPENLVSVFDVVTGQVDLTWDFDGATKNFQNFNVYRNSLIIGTTTDTVFSDVLSAFGHYHYKVTAVHEEGESIATNTETIIYYAVPPGNLAANLNENNGEVALNWKPGESAIEYAVYEDFEDGTANNWNLDDTRFSVTDGHLVMNGNSDDTWATAYINQTFEDFTLEFEFIRQQSDNTKNSAIGAFICSDGGVGDGDGYFIDFTYTGSYSIWEITNGSATNIINWTSNSYINTDLGATNIATIIADMHHYKIYINGHYLTSFYDYSYSSGHIALCTYDNEDGVNEVWFDNIMVTTENKFGKSIQNNFNNNNNSVANNGGPSISILKEQNNPYIEPTGILRDIINIKSKSSFQNYNIYRNNAIIGTTTDTSYIDTLTVLGEYYYKVTAMHNEGESAPTNSEKIIYSAIGIDVDSLDFGIVVIGETRTLPITISNRGGTPLTGFISTPNSYSTSPASSLSYTIAPYSSSTFDITFTPAATKAYPDNLTITHNSFGESKTVFVYGRGANLFSLPYSESFESDFGGWIQSANDDYFWSRGFGTTPSGGTGPSNAFDGNYYIYINSYFAFPYKKIGLEGLFNFENTDNPLLTFWYNMYGSQMGTLTVQISKDNGVSWTDEWSLSGNQGTEWHKANISLAAYKGIDRVAIRFWGVTRYNDLSDMAIDLIEVKNDLVAPYNLFCSLNSMSGEVSLNWDIDWNKPFEHFNIYRDSVLIGTSSLQNYTDTLLNYGSYDYYVTTLYSSGESAPSNTKSVLWETTDFYTTPDKLTATLVPQDSTTKVLTINNMGGTELDYSISIEYEAISSGKSKMSIAEVEEAVLGKSKIYDRPIEIESYCASEGKIVKTVFTKPEDIIHTEYSDAKSNLSVLLLGAENNTSRLEDVQNKIIGTGKFSSVTYIQVSAVTPTLTELHTFDVVMVWSDSRYENNVLLGDNLADYVDDGGGVVSAVFEVTNSTDSAFYLQGRWISDNYIVLTKSNTNTSYSNLGVYNTFHPIMDSVNSFTGKYKPESSNLTSGAEMIASWESGEPLVAVKDINYMHRVDLGFWPVSNNVDSNNGWISSTDGALIMANALEWVAGASGGWLSVNTASGTIAGNDSANVEVRFNASTLNPGTYHANVIVSNPEKAQVNIPVSLTVMHQISVDAMAFLEGPFSNGQMNNLLKIYDFIPLTQPYNTAPWNYTGTESVTAIPNNNVVDWILVEVRETSGDASTATSGTVIGRRAGFILQDGSIVDTDGSSPLTFSTVDLQNVFAVLYHRNHIPIMSANPLSVSGTVYSIDFSTSATQVYGGASACKELTSGIWGMYSGNALNDSQIDNKDKNDVWEIEKGNTGYYNGDMNMNGQVDDTDKQVFWELNAGKSCKVPE